MVPLLARQASSAPMRSTYEEDDGLTVWWGALVECESALARLGRDRTLPVAGVERSRRRLEGLARSWVEVAPSQRLREMAQRLVRVHPLRAADGLQLAAALVASEQRPETLGFVCLDERLSDAARQEGFRIVKGPGARAGRRKR